MIAQSVVDKPRSSVAAGEKKNTIMSDTSRTSIRRRKMKLTPDLVTSLMDLPSSPCRLQAPLDVAKKKEKTEASPRSCNGRSESVSAGRWVKRKEHRR